MTLNELLAHLRVAVLRDAAEPHLWADAELALYLNEGYTQFARRTHALTDEVEMTTTAGQAAYPLDDEVVFVANVRHADTGCRLQERSRRQMRERWHQGRPYTYTTSTGQRVLRVSPTPDGAYDLVLLVALRPTPLVDPDDVPELDEDYHLALCDYAAWRALCNNDPDGTATVVAEEFRVRWDLACRDAKRDVHRLRRGDHPMARGNWTGKIRGGW